MIDDRSSKLRQAILRAGDYFEKSHETLELPDRVINLAIALEALFSPENQEQLKFRTAHGAAQFLGATPVEKERIFNDVGDLYGRRNKLVHGGYSVEAYYDGTFVQLDEVQLWSGLIRRSILRFFVLALRGETKRSKVLEQLEHAAFDPAATEEIQRLSDMDTYLAEQGL
jgi:hypothetical protein